MALFHLNRNLARELSQMPEVAELLAEAAEPARERAEQFVQQLGGPGHRRGFMPRGGHSRQIVVEIEGGEVFLANIEHGGHLMEYGSRNNPPHAPLRRGAQAAGLRLGGD